MRRLLVFVALGSSSVAQQPVIDRGIATAKAPLRQPVERPGKGFTGDSFRLGELGQIWMIEALRVWAIPNTAPACAGSPDALLEKLTLYGALYNAPVPGQPECDCHALIPVQPLSIGKTIPGGSVTVSSGLWRIDFKEVRWSVPGGTDVLFTVRPTAKAGQTCPIVGTWTLAATPAEPGHQLHQFDRKRVPAGKAEAAPRQIGVQVWAHRD